MKERDIKLLWGRSGGFCAMCKMKLSQDVQAESGSFPIGEAAHIVGESSDGPRGSSLLTDPERDGYTNRILLCPTDHTLIDKAPANYPVERLHILKRDHELWVEQQLSATDERNRVAQEIYAALVDAAAETCDFENWNRWASRLVGAQPTWTNGSSNTIYRFRQRIIGAAWPRVNTELERALETLARCMNGTAQRFRDESESRGPEPEDERVEVKYYKSARNKADYDVMFDRWERWIAHLDLLVLSSTKSANWLAEVVRRDLNPAFHAVSGKFILTVPKGFGFTTIAPEFTANEKSVLPEGLDLAQPDVADDDDGE